MTPNELIERLTIALQNALVQCRALKAQCSELTEQLRRKSIVSCIGGHMCTLCHSGWESQPPDGAAVHGETHYSTCLLYRPEHAAIAPKQFRSPL